MANTTPPTFDEWVEYCFTQGYSDFFDEMENDETSSRVARFVECDNRMIIEYMTRLFRNPSIIRNRYSEQQVADSVWFIFGIGTEYCGHLCSKTVPEDLRIECMRAVANLYLEFFDIVCDTEGGSADMRLGSPLNGAVYMIWDMGAIEGALIKKKGQARLRETAFSVIETILARCRTTTCLYSALHGLGEVQGYPGNKQRVESVIDRFLQRSDLDSDVRAYALDARKGQVL